MNLAQAMARIDMLKAQIKSAEEEIEDLFAGFSESTKVGTYPAGDFILKVEQNKRFDAATAAKTLEKGQLKAISVLKPDSVKAKAILSGNDYAKCQKVFGVKRTVVPVTDEDD